MFPPWYTAEESTESAETGATCDNPDRLPDDCWFEGFRDTEEADIDSENTLKPDPNRPVGKRIDWDNHTGFFGPGTVGMTLGGVFGFLSFLAFYRATQPIGSIADFLGICFAALFFSIGPAIGAAYGSLFMHDAWAWQNVKKLPLAYKLPLAVLDGCLCTALLGHAIIPSIHSVLAMLAGGLACMIDVFLFHGCDIEID